MGYTHLETFTWQNLTPAERVTLPWVPEVFLACGGIFGVGRRTKPREKLFRAGHYKDLTETGNRAKKVSGTLGRVAGLADRATRLGGSPHLSCKRDQIKMRDYMDRRVTPP